MLSIMDASGSVMSELLQAYWVMALASRMEEKSFDTPSLDPLFMRHDAVLRDGEQEWTQDKVREKHV
ncbi:hypothetical protein [Paenibacillus agaridevorans]|uniref:hypothetical protein n=1 Tax=Paenibacillus agaridevorans TaxID=171404 RepID=UPI001BE407F4|nr:hypothetical protein [Paenibacillus agaridevorans]